MKKIAIFLVVIGMIATITLPKVNAQSFSVSPYGGLSSDQSGLISQTDPVGGVNALAGLAHGALSLGIGMDGGQLYHYKTVLISDDSIRTTVYKKVNAPSLQFIAALSIPERRSSLLAGPVIGVAGGVAFPSNIDSGPVGMVKVFTQLNLGGNTFSGNYHVGFFVQGAFNFLYTGPQPIYSSTIFCGMRFTALHAF